MTESAAARFSKTQHRVSTPRAPCWAPTGTSANGKGTGFPENVRGSWQRRRRQVPCGLETRILWLSAQVSWVGGLRVQPLILSYASNDGQVSVPSLSLRAAGWQSNTAPTDCPEIPSLLLQVPKGRPTPYPILVIALGQSPQIPSPSQAAQRGWHGGHYSQGAS